MSNDPLKIGIQGSDEKLLLAMPINWELYDPFNDVCLSISTDEDSSVEVYTIVLSDPGIMQACFNFAFRLMGSTGLLFESVSSGSDTKRDASLLKILPVNLNADDSLDESLEKSLAIFLFIRNGLLSFRILDIIF